MGGQSSRPGGTLEVVAAVVAVVVAKDAGELGPGGVPPPAHDASKRAAARRSRAWTTPAG
jgi:hypothetical protein